MIFRVFWLTVLIWPDASKTPRHEPLTANRRQSPLGFYTFWGARCNDRNVASKQAVVIVHLSLKAANRTIELVFWRVQRRV